MFVDLLVNIRGHLLLHKLKQLSDLIWLPPAVPTPAAVPGPQNGILQVKLARSDAQTGQQDNRRARQHTLKSLIFGSLQYFSTVSKFWHGLSVLRSSGVASRALTYLENT